MKIEGHGQAKIFTQQEIELLFNEGLQTSRDRALFGVCLYTACRIAEACSLKVIDVFTPAGAIRSEMIIRKGNTKGKLGTRTIPIIQELRLLLETYNIPTPLPIPQPPPQPPLETRKPGSRLSPVPRSLRKSRHHRRFHPQPQKVGTDSDEQRGYPAADYSRNQRTPQPRSSCRNT
jgi:integrase